MSHKIRGVPLSDLFYLEPTRELDVIQILEIAHGLRPLADLEAILWISTQVSATVHLFQDMSKTVQT